MSIVTTETNQCDNFHLPQNKWAGQCTTIKGIDYKKRIIVSYLKKLSSSNINIHRLQSGENLCVTSFVRPEIEHLSIFF